MHDGRFDDPLAIPLTADEQMAAGLVGIDAEHLEDLWVALFTVPEPAANTATRGVVLGLIAAASWRASAAAGIGAIGIRVAAPTDTIGPPASTPLGRILQRQGVRATDFLPDIADLIGKAVVVGAQAVGIDRIRQRSDGH